MFRSLRAVVTAAACALPMLAAVAAPANRYTMEALAELPCDQAAIRINEGLQAQDREALYAAGQMYDEGWCVAREPARTVQLWQAAVDAGSVEAAGALALKMGRGEGLSQDYAAAGDLLKKAGVSVGDVEIPDAYTRGYSYTWLRATQAELRNAKEIAKLGVQGSADVEFNARRGVAEVTSFRRTDGGDAMIGSRIDRSRGVVRQVIAEAAATASGKLAKPDPSRLADVSFRERFAIAPGADYESDLSRRANRTLNLQFINGVPRN